MMKKSYSELRRLNTFQQRFEYLRIGGSIGEQTFGFDRYLNQIFYGSKEWKAVRNQVIVRDNGNDLGVQGYPIPRFLVVHHLNPITVQDITNHQPWILDPQYLICVSQQTHKAIHYGNNRMLPKIVIQRTPFDTCPWKK